MYGSKKPEGKTYKVTHVFTFDPVANSWCFDTEIPTNAGDLANILSIRNKYESSLIKPGSQEVIVEFEKAALAEAQKKRFHIAFQNNHNNKKNKCDNIEFVEKLVAILSEHRAETYQEWIRVGWCLRNIDCRLLPAWIEFSKKSSKFMEGECEKVWNYMKEDGLGIGTLHMWSKADNPDQYREHCKIDLMALIHRSTSETHTDIARVVHFLFRYYFVCVSIKNNMWFEFRDHRWVPCDSGHVLRAKISNEVVREYCRQAAYYNDKASNEQVEAEQQRYLEIVKKLNSISLKLKLTCFKDNIMKECREQFYLEKFEEKLDSRCNLLGFNNGVYDLESEEFRDGRPEDYVSFSTNTDYYPYDPTNASSIKMQEFISKIFTLPHVKKYAMTLLSSFLNGNIREEKFHVWTGSGSNGKSKFIELFERSFGDYCVKFPITLLTQKRAASNAATSELARAKGKRFAALQEPSEDEKLNIGLMKELSGGDKIMARLIYKEPIEFKPQFKMILACNHLPIIPSDDGGTWRRIRVVEFTSKFVENPDPGNPHEFLMDMEMAQKFEDWKEPFMSLLIDMYINCYRKTGIREPEEVMKCTRDYQRSNDGFLDFVESEMDKVSDAITIDSGEVFSNFRSWAADNGLNQFKNTPRKTFHKAVSKILNQSPNMKSPIWKGVAMKNKNVITDDLD
jgi:P4 family phage/plasmid primase-like protien